MAKAEGQKLKLLYIIQMLENDSDEKHPITTKEIIDRLADLDIKAERKSIYDDIECLQSFGYDIVKLSSRLGGGYYLKNREFDLSDIKILIDAVSSSRYIPLKRSKELIRKLEKKAGRSSVGLNNRQIYPADRIKTESDSLLINLDIVFEAISEKKNISFDLMKWTQDKQFEENGKLSISPIAITVMADGYHVTGYKSDAVLVDVALNSIAHVEILQDEEYVSGDFDISSLNQLTNDPFKGEDDESEIVTMRFPNDLAEAVINKLGRDVDMRPVGKDYFRVRAQVKTSGDFFGWMCSLGREAELVAPDGVKARYLSWLNGIIESNE